MFSEIVMIRHARPLAERRAARRCCGPYRWRPCPPGRGRGFYVSQGFEDRVDEAGSSFRLRFGPARRHWDGARDRRGAWDLDAWSPIVARLPRRRGFLAGASLGRGMMAFLDPTIFADARDAAIAADAAARAAADEDAACDAARDAACEAACEASRDDDAAPA